MNRIAKLEWAAFAALCLLVQSTNAAEGLIVAAAVLAVSFGSRIIFYPFRKILTPIFQILFLLVLISTFFEVLSFLFPFSLPEVVPQTIFASFLLSIASQKISETFEIGGLFLVFIFALVLFNLAGPVNTQFYPAILISTGFVFALLNFIYTSRKNG